MKKALLTILIILAIIFTITIFIVSKNETYLLLDTSITREIFTTFSRYKFLVDINLLLTNYTLGSGFVFLILSLILFFKKRFKQLLIFLFFGLLLLLTEESIKSLVQRLRPFLKAPGISNLSQDTLIATDYSFPSGHSMFAFYVASFIAFRFAGKRRRIYQILLFSLAGLVALSRIILGVHFLSDTITGACIGIVFGYVSKLVEESGALRKISS